MGFFIAVLIILLLPFIIPALGRMIKNYAMGRVEDRMRRMMGMPTRSEEKKARKAREKEERKESRRGGWSGSTTTGDSGTGRYAFRGRGRNHNVGNPAESRRMLRIYAEDVEYVEIREYSAELRFEQDDKGHTAKVIYEEQLSDAEFVVIK